MKWLCVCILFRVANARFLVQNAAMPFFGMAPAFYVISLSGNITGQPKTFCKQNLSPLFSVKQISVILFPHAQGMKTGITDSFFHESKSAFRKNFPCHKRDDMTICRRLWFLKVRFVWISVYCFIIMNGWEK